MINSVALYDTLYIGNKLQKYLDDFNSSEIQLFCYFSCLLSLYDGNPISFWGYNFIRNGIGVPLSNDVSESLMVLLRNEELIVNNEYYNITKNGLEKCNVLSSITIFNTRIKYLDAACDSLLSIPEGLIRNAINNEPVLNGAIYSSLRNLIDEENGSISILYEQFELLQSVFQSQEDDLFIPATTWIRYLQTKLTD